RVTRLAPSPTGALHLGNARTFLVNWALARGRNWRIVLRIEDLDTPRNKPGATEQALRDLEWLGIDWDEGPFIQSGDLAHHRAAMVSLAGRGLAYPCELTRAQIEAAASAPQDDPAGGGHELRFPPELRPPIAPRPFDQPSTGWRFVTPDRAVEFDDDFAGAQRYRPMDTIGDFIVWTVRGQPAYQLAVVVDDARQGVTDIVRGDDLLESAARQLLLYEALSLGPLPRYCHLPLVRGADGRRLAKRHGDTRLSRYRELGVAPERMIGLMACWCGILGDRAPLSSEEFRGRLDLATMPRSPITFAPEDDAWLLNQS
ncbi:MAG: tRNA glutamyl-Q(34) synthetase GluQRS, partial [Phycisphaerae bacterium]|nr:tRNA glutamyl-Q(34) synthetase GluQRS [Phycisphaerae bacterium]